jgi:N-glycosidase YbiA
MNYNIDHKEIRVYQLENSCPFRKNNEEFGGLSNMATIYPLKVNQVNIKTSEALYQACRFPHFPEIQKKIIDEKSPMTVKMISSSNKKFSRKDWDFIRLKVMKWCISVKLAQNFNSFGSLLHQTGLRNIVENSAKDNFWGAIPNGDSTIFTGKNALGRLLMDLRKTFNSEHQYSLLYVEPPQIDNFLLFGEQIKIIDERDNFVNWLHHYWKTNLTMQVENYSNNEFENSFAVHPENKLQEETQTIKKKTTKKQSKNTKVKAKSTGSKNPPDLFSGL